MDKIKDKLRNVHEKIKSSPVADAAVKTLLDQIPIAGSFFNRLYDNMNDTQNKKIEKIINMLEILLEKNNDNIKNELSKLANLPNTKHQVGYNEVSYTIITIDHDSNLSQVLQSVAHALNVQLNENGSKIPFSSKVFEEYKNNNRLFLFGKSGCGKSRFMYELVKKNLAKASKENKKYSKIVIINPARKVGEISGTTSVYNLEQESDNGIILWDNFPDDIRAPDKLSDTEEALRSIVRSKAAKAYVALNPSKLQLYRNRIPTFNNIIGCSVELKLDEENDIKLLLQKYGTKISKFCIPFDVIKKDLDEIARILFTKDNTPLTVLIYYRKFIEEYSPIPKDGILVANELFLKDKISFYKDQFKKINCTENRTECEFLYTLKLSLLLKMNTEPSSLAGLQESLFDSNFIDDPTEQLSMWTYMSGPYVTMTDVARDAIPISKFAMTKITSKIIDNFDSIIIPKEDKIMYSLGTFFGENIKSINSSKFSEFLDKKILSEENRFEFNFITGLGVGTSKNFSSLEDNLQKYLFNLGNRKHNFALHLGYGIGQLFSSYPLQDQNMLLIQVKKNPALAHGFANGFCLEFLQTPSRIRRKMLKYEGTEKTSTIPSKPFSSSIKTVVENYPIRNKMLKAISKNRDFSHGLGMGIGQNFFLMLEELQYDALYFVGKHNDFAHGLGEGLGQVFATLPEELYQKIKESINDSGPFAIGLGEGIGIRFVTESDPELKNNMEILLHANDDFARGLGDGIGKTFNFISDKLQNQALKLIKKYKDNLDFSHGVGDGVGKNIPFISNSLFNKIKKMMDKDPNFAHGVGVGFGFKFADRSEKIQEVGEQLMSKNKRFAHGLGLGIGRTFDTRFSELVKKAEKFMKKSNSFTSGLGVGVGMVYPHLEDKIKEYVKRLATTNRHFKDSLLSESSSGNLLETEIENMLRQDYMKISHHETKPVLGEISDTIHNISVEGPKSTDAVSQSIIKYIQDGFDIKTEDMKKNIDYNFIYDGDKFYVRKNDNSTVTIELIENEVI